MQKQVWKDGACQERFTFDAVGVQLLGWTLCERFVEEKQGLEMRLTGRHPFWFVPLGIQALFHGI